MVRVGVTDAKRAMQVQLQQLEQVQTERDALHARFEAATAGARQAAGAQALLLERRGSALEEALAQREAELEAALAGAGPGAEAEARAAGQRCAQVCKSKWCDNPQGSWAGRVWPARAPP